ncbi:hypothetical protein WN943_023165 [Citrus x changshan-huyou]
MPLVEEHSWIRHQKQPEISLMPLQWLSNYEQFHQNSEPIKGVRWSYGGVLFMPPCNTRNDLLPPPKRVNEVSTTSLEQQVSNLTSLVQQLVLEQQGGRITLILGIGTNSKAFLIWHHIDHRATPNSGCNSLTKSGHLHLLKVKENAGAMSLRSGKQLEPLLAKPSKVSTTSSHCMTNLSPEALHLIRKDDSHSSLSVDLSGQAERKMVDMEKRMIQVYMVMVKRCVEDFWLVWRNMVEFHKEVFQGSLDLEILFETGNVRDYHPFITLILDPKISGREGGVSQQSVAASCATMKGRQLACVVIDMWQEITDVIDDSKELLDLLFGKDWLKDGGHGLLKNGRGNFEAKRKDCPLKTGVQLDLWWGKFCSGFQVLDKLDCFLRFNWAIFGKMTFLFANETSAFPSVRKPFGMGLPFSEKAKLFGMPFPGWK